MREKRRRGVSQSQKPSKGALFVTGGSHGIGQDAFVTLSSHYDRAYNFDIGDGRDVRDYSALEAAFAETLSHERQNDLVLSAGVFRPVDFLRQTPSEIDFVVDTNVKGVLYAALAFLKWHEATSHPIIPNIVIISSISAFFHGGRVNVVYDGTKAFLSYIVRDLANFNCIVNTIEPGTIRQTEIGVWAPDFTKDPEARTTVEQGQAGDVQRLGREVTKANITSVIEMLLFRNGDGAINGTSITVDGGLTSLRERF